MGGGGEGRAQPKTKRHPKNATPPPQKQTKEINSCFLCDFEELSLFSQHEYSNL